MALYFFNCESMYNLADVPAQIYDRKTAARRFDTIHDILPKCAYRNAPWRKRVPTHMRLSGTEGLKSVRTERKSILLTVLDQPLLNILYKESNIS